MVKIDMITGFLGSGKTTFIKNYVHYLNQQNKKVCVIENDFGAINIDMMLLGELQSDLCDVEMVIGGDVDCHKRRLKTKLISMAMLGYERIILEPSGIFDVEDMLDLLYEAPLEDWYELNNIITIVDARLDKENMSNESDYILASQLSKAGSIILSKTQYVTPSKIEETINYLNTTLAKIQCKRKIIHYFDLPWDQYKSEDYQKIENGHYVSFPYLKQRVMYESQYETLFFMNFKLSLLQVKKLTEQLFENHEIGNLIRVKGFVKDAEWYEINATQNELNISKIQAGQSVLIMIGESLQKERIEEIVRVFN